jgi:hypothetical protein
MRSQEDSQVFRDTLSVESHSAVRCCRPARSIPRKPHGQLPCRVSFRVSSGAKNLKTVANRRRYLKPECGWMLLIQKILAKNGKGRQSAEM